MVRDDRATHQPGINFLVQNRYFQVKTTKFLFELLFIATFITVNRQFFAPLICRYAIATIKEKRKCNARFAQKKTSGNLESVDLLDDSVGGDASAISVLLHESKVQLLHPLSQLQDGHGLQRLE
jgi:hypothetical protein